MRALLDAGLIEVVGQKEVPGRPSLYGTSGTFLKTFGLKNLEELYVSHNAITDLAGLESNNALRVLDFSNNQVSKLEHLSHLKELEELWASNNQLSSFNEVERELKDKENLKTVYFEGNPLQTNGPVVYRNKVRLAIPQIMQIDASKCSTTVLPLPLPPTNC